MLLAAMVFLLLFASIFRSTMMVFDGKLQHAILSDTRATMASVRRFFSDTAGIVVLLGMGWVIGDGVYSSGFMVFGGADVLVGIGFLLRK